MQYCPKCASERIMKNGRHLERQRFRCKDCGFQFTRDTPRGRPATEKAMAILRYTLGLSFNAIARIYGVATSTVMRWVRDFAEKTYEKPSPGEAVIMELDEMWHYLHSKKTNYGSGKLIVAIPVNSLSAYDREVSKNGSLSARIYEVCAERDGLKGQVRDYERVRRAIGPEQADRILEAAYQQEQVEKEQKWGARSKIRVGAR